jgi:UDP-2-acetamido-3-amino-2,3-dideoxy-glucuronate N-acetyltransferase
MPQIAPFQIAPRYGASPTEVRAQLVDYSRSHHEQPRHGLAALTSAGTGSFGRVGAPLHFIHDRALVETQAIGPRTRVWAFAHVMDGAVIGADCNICDHTFIEGDVVIGDRVTIKSGVYLWDGLRVEHDVFIGPQAAFTNDLFPRSKQPFDRAITTIRRGASIGAGAVVLPGLTIGERAMVGAGAVVTKDVPSDVVVSGNPARVVRRLIADGGCQARPGGMRQ